MQFSAIRYVDSKRCTPHSPTCYLPSPGKNSGVTPMALHTNFCPSYAALQGPEFSCFHANPRRSRKVLYHNLRTPSAQAGTPSRVSYLLVNFYYSPWYRQNWGIVIILRRLVHFLHGQFYISLKG